jgi:predicted porin
MNRKTGIKNGCLLGAAALLMSIWGMPATAADLGGDCCADLEERIAELEATTARKGNHKVSLTVTGWVNEEIAFWDDGTERDVYVGTSPVQQSRFKFLGQARINKDWSAGYLLEIGVNGNPGGQWDQTGPESKSATTPNSVPVIRRSSWYLKSETLGKILVGDDAMTTYHLLAESDTTMTRKIHHDEAEPDFQAKFFVRDRSGKYINAGGNLRWSDILRGYNNSTPGNGARRNIVRYDSPTVSGFTASASWGEDDLWDTTIAYAGGFGEFTVNGRAGYGHSNDGASIPCHAVPTSGNNGDCDWWGVSGFVQHKPTGLFVLASYGQQNDNSRAQDEAAGQPGTVDKTDTTWLVQAGIEHKWLSLGKTNFFGEYRHDDAGSNLSASGVLRTQGADIDFWSAGAIQHLEAADAMLYLLYQHADGNVLANVGGSIDNVQIDSFQQVIAGMRIAF